MQPFSCSGYRRHWDVDNRPTVNLFPRRSRGMHEDDVESFGIRVPFAYTFTRIR